MIVLFLFIILLVPNYGYTQRVQLTGIPGQDSGMDITDSLNQIMAPYYTEITNLNNRLRDQELEQILWQEFRSNVNNFEQVNRYLFGFDSAFRSTTNEVTDPSALSVQLQRSAKYGEHLITIRQLAQAHSFASDPVSVEKQLPKGVFQVIVGESTNSVNFPGGTILNMFESLKGALSETADVQLLNASQNEKIISIAGKNQGLDYEIKFSGDTLPIEEATLISRGETFETNFSWASLRENDELFITNSSENLPIDFKIPDNTALQFSVKAIDLPEVPEVERISLENVPLDKTGEISQKGIVIPGAKPILRDFDSIVISAPKDPVQTINLNFTDNSRESLPLSDTNFIINLDEYANKTLRSIEVISEDKIAEVSDFVFKTQPNGSLQANNEINKAQDAIFLLNGVELKRSKNTVRDVIGGVTLDLLRANPQQQIRLKITPDLNLVKESIMQWALEYNNIMEEIDTMTTLPFEKIGRIKPLHEREENNEDLKEGTFFGNSTLITFKDRLRRMSSSSHGPTSDGISLLDQLGIYVRRQNSFNNDPDALRKGILTVNVAELDEALANNYEEIKNMFAYDRDNNNVADIGLVVMALDVNKMMIGNEGYLTRIDTTYNNRLKEMITQIERKEDSLDRTEFTERSALLEMNQAIIQSKEISESLQQRWK